MARTKKKDINRKDGRVNLFFRYNGKGYCVTGTDKEDAIFKKQERIEALRTGQENRENPTLNYYYEHVFKPSRRGKVKGSTVRAQNSQFKNAAEVMIESADRSFGDLRMQDVKVADVLAVQKALRDAGRSTQTVNDTIAHISHVFHKAVLDRTITWNPCVSVDKLQRTEPKCKDTKHRALTEKEVKDFFTALSGSYYENLCKMMLQTGMRIGEATALTIPDFDMNEGVIHITKTVSRDEDGIFYVSQMPKSDAGFRDIPMTDAIKQIFRDQLQLNEMIFGSIGFNDPVFQSCEGGLMREYSLNREIKRKCKQIGIAQFTSHGFRDTFTTRFIEQRPQDYKILSEMLGHADVSITLNLYAAHQSRNKQTEAMNNIVIAM